MKRIESASNPFYRMCKSLLSRQGIKDEQKILVAGRKIVPEYLKKDDLRHHALIISDPEQIPTLKFKQSLDVYWFKKNLFEEIDESGTKFPILIVDAPPIPEANLKNKPAGLEVVLAMSNPLNLGAALRVCEAFSADRVILLKECAHPFLPKVIRSSSGSSLKINLCFGPSIQNLTAYDAEELTALDLAGEPIQKFLWPNNTRLFIGEEGRGVPEKMQFKHRLTIPIAAEVDSLNAVSAVSIALYSYRQKHPRS